MRVYDDRHAPYNRFVQAARLRVILSTQLDVTLEISQFSPYRSHSAWLNQNNAKLDRPIDQNRVQLIASQGLAVSVRSAGTRRQVGNEGRSAAHPPNLSQFRPCSVPNGGGDAELVEQRESGGRQAFTTDLLPRIAVFFHENHAPSG
jgi:hypothetical protein